MIVSMDDAQSRLVGSCEVQHLRCGLDVTQHVLRESCMLSALRHAAFKIIQANEVFFQRWFARRPQGSHHASTS